MSNMGHCRWQNTSNDIEDCEEHVNDKLGKNEARARKNLLETAANMLCELGMEVDISGLDAKLAVIQAAPDDSDD
jgi:hypothetical protein